MKKIVLAMLLIGIVACTKTENENVNIKSSQKTSITAPLKTIDIKLANKLFCEYYKIADTIKLKAFTINNEILDAISTLKENTNVHSYRMYMSNQGIIVIGVDGNHHELDGQILLINSPDNGPCPDLCDEASEVTYPY